MNYDPYVFDYIIYITYIILLCYMYYLSKETAFFRGSICRLSTSVDFFIKSLIVLATLPLL